MQYKICPSNCQSLLGAKCRWQGQWHLAMSLSHYACFNCTLCQSTLWSTLTWGQTSYPSWFLLHVQCCGDMVAWRRQLHSRHLCSSHSFFTLYEHQCIGIQLESGDGFRICEWTVVPVRVTPYQLFGDAGSFLDLKRFQWSSACRQPRKTVRRWCSFWKKGEEHDTGVITSWLGRWHCDLSVIRYLWWQSTCQGRTMQRQIVFLFFIWRFLARLNMP